MKGAFANFGDEKSEDEQQSSAPPLERERRPYKAPQDSHSVHNGRNNSQNNSPNTETTGIFTIDEDLIANDINNFNEQDSSNVNTPSSATNTQTIGSQPVPSIIISNQIHEDQPQSPPIEIPIREHRPYSYSASAPSETSGISLMSIMAQNIPLDSLSTKALRQLLLEERVSTAHILEKRDLISKVEILIKNIRGEIANQNNDEMLCRICVDNVINCVLLECGHYTLCLECAETIKKSTKECPICRQTITRIVHTFRS